MKSIYITTNIWIETVAACIKRSMNYRSNFLLSLVDALVWLSISLSFFFILIDNFESVGGYGKSEVLILIGVAEIIKSNVFAFFVSGISKIPGYINSGELDLHITRPINLTFYLCTREFELPELLSSIPGAIMITLGIMEIDTFQLSGIFGMILFVILSIFIVVNFWLTLISVSFWTKNQTNMNEVAISAISLMKYPKTVYNGIGKFVLTFIVPVSVLANTPMEVLRGNVLPSQVADFIIILITSFLLRKIVWTLGIRSYDSASL